MGNLVGLTFAMQEETRVPEGNSHRRLTVYGKLPQFDPGFEPGTFLLCRDSVNHYIKVPPYLLPQNIIYTSWLVDDHQ